MKFLPEHWLSETTRKDEHEQPNGKLKPSKHLKNNPGHKFDLMVLSRVPSHRLKQKILED